MRTITKTDVAKVVRTMVTDYGKNYQDPTRTFFSFDGNTGQCFVGVLLDRLGITPRRATMGKLTIDPQSNYAMMPDVARIERHTFTDRETGEVYRFEPGIGVLLDRSINRNDGGTPWGIIAQEIWGVDEIRELPKDCPCPLCDPEARKPVYHPVYKPAPGPKYDPVHKFTGLPESFEQYKKEMTKTLVASV